MSRLIIVALGLIAFAALAQIEATVNGQVVDAATGEPVPFASITTTNRDGGAVITGVLADEDGHFVIQLDLPGISADSIDLTVEQNVLTVHAERRAPESEAERIVDERSYGVFSRQLFLGDTLDSDKLTASYDAGVLTLSIPIAEKAKPRKVEIGTASGQAPKEINAA